ncbi:MAG: hypothetical protein K8T10_08310 [Candidatus Eremiobacteraeota bacterium]|nr:hypothetical protein [Candidatus Eremiobacteraeota bacterium]
MSNLVVEDHFNRRIRNGKREVRLLKKHVFTTITRGLRRIQKKLRVLRDFVVYLNLAHTTSYFTSIPFPRANSLIASSSLFLAFFANGVLNDIHLPFLLTSKIIACKGSIVLLIIK